MFKKRVTYVLFVAAMLLVSRLGIAAGTGIMSGQLKAEWRDGRLSLWNVQSDEPFLRDARLGTDTGWESCRTETVRDPVWGAGRSILCEETSGDLSRVTLFEQLPFALLQRTLVNHGQEPRVVDKDPMISGSVHLGISPDRLKTMSTAGLRDVAEHPGGYSFMAVGDPVSRRGVVCGWLTHQQGTGIVFSDVHGGTAVLSARIDYGDWRIPRETEAATETLLIGYFDDIRIGLEQYADAIARQLGIHLPQQPTVYCTWYHGGASDEERMAENTDFVRKRMKRYGFHVMQIDDKWQAGVSNNGPRKDFSKALADGPYPSGMKQTADYIAARGLTPGIWFMPFAGTWNDPYWGDKQDLFYRQGTSADNYISETREGQPADDEPAEAPYVVRWGGTCLDMTNPKSQAYLRSIVDRIANEWGYKYFKLDGLWTATGTRLQYVNSFYQDDDLGKPSRFDRSITPIAAYRQGLDIIRETAGSDVFLLGCCANQNMRSFGPAFGKVDAMRVGPDNGASPEGLVRGPMFSSRVFFLNGRVWYNDPDPVYVRSSFPEPMAKTSVSWTAITGSLHSSSYSYYELPTDRLDILLRSLPAHGLLTVRPVDYLEHDPARVWLLTDDRDEQRKDVIGLFNWDITAPTKIEYPLDRIGLPVADKYVGFDYWADQFIAPLSDTISVNVPPGGCGIISVRPSVDHPQVVSTSRHVTQGVVDLRNEQWDASGATLSGVSQIVGGEQYELRLVVPTGKTGWVMQQVEIGSVSRARDLRSSGAPAAAVDGELVGITPGAVDVAFTQHDAEIRVQFRCPQDAEVTWAARFQRRP